MGEYKSHTFPVKLGSFVEVICPESLDGSMVKAEIESRSHE